MSRAKFVVCRIVTVIIVLTGVFGTGFLISKHRGTLALLILSMTLILTIIGIALSYQPGYGDADYERMRKQQKQAKENPVNQQVSDSVTTSDINRHKQYGGNTRQFGETRHTRHHRHWPWKHNQEGA